MEWTKYINIGTVPTVLMTPEECKDEKKILDTVKIIASDYFFDFIEIIEINNKKIRNEIKEIINISHLKTMFTAGHIIFTEGLDLNSPDRNKRKESIDLIKESMEMALFFESGKFLITSGRDVPESKRDDAKKALVDSLVKICEHAKKISINKQKPLSVVMEPFDRDFNFKFLIGPTIEAVEVVKKVREYHHNMGLMLDLGHLPLLGEDIETSISYASPYLEHAHIGNCVTKNKRSPRFGDSHPYFGYPDSDIGVEEVKTFLSSLKDNDYFGPKQENKKEDSLPSISLEIVREKGEDIRLVIENTKRVFNKAWSFMS